MTEQEHINYDRIAEAIDYIKTNFKEQPSLNQIAETVHLSPYHFQRLFTDWAGVSPKKFMQYMSVEYAKQLLKENKRLFLIQPMKQVYPALGDFTTCLLILKG